MQADQMNHWIKNEKQGQLVVRFDGQEVRVIFTNLLENKHQAVSQGLRPGFSSPCYTEI